jgi:hypothetical protein
MISKRYIHNPQADVALANYNFFRPRKTASGKDSKDLPSRRYASRIRKIMLKLVLFVCRATVFSNLAI